MITLPDAGLFRAYDLRGIAYETLHPHDMETICHAFASAVIDASGTSHPAIVLVRDGRLSSPVLAQAATAGLRRAGACVIDAGIGPSPYAYFTAQHVHAHGCIMITGSHNPPTHNGMKCMLMGRPFFGEALLALRARLAKNDVHHGAGTLEYCDYRETYAHALLKELASIRLDFPVIWDAGNGAAGDIITMLTPHIQATSHMHLYCDIDGNFPNHHPDPSDVHTLENLQAMVLQNSGAVGLAFDGDGDRLGVVDEKGRIISPDHLLMLLARDVLQSTPYATILADVKTSDAFFADVRTRGGHAVMAQTGHALIKERMRETSAAFAGEASGHLFFADRYFGFDDGLYAAIRILSLRARAGKPLSDLIDALPVLHTSAEMRIPCDDDQKFAVVTRIAEALIAQGATVNTLDGVRVSSADGWWLLRASNTQAALVARAEGNSETALAKQMQALWEVLAHAGLPAP